MVGRLHSDLLYRRFTLAHLSRATTTPRASLARIEKQASSSARQRQLMNHFSPAYAEKKNKKTYKSARRLLVKRINLYTTNDNKIDFVIDESANSHTQFLISLVHWADAFTPNLSTIVRATEVATATS